MAHRSVGLYMQDQAQTALVLETTLLVVVSIGVTTYATDLFTQILDEAWGGLENKHSTDVESRAPPPPRVCVSGGVLRASTRLTCNLLLLLLASVLRRY